MRLATSSRRAALAFCCLVAASCGRSPPAAPLPLPRASVATDSLPAPRTLETPWNARPLAALNAATTERGADEAVAEPLAQASTAAPLPRIRDLAATPDAQSRALIREPGAKQPEVQEPQQRLAVAAPRQNTFVPISLPVVKAPAPSTNAPVLPDRPTFDLPDPSRPAPAALATAPWRPAAVSLPRATPGQPAPQESAPANVPARPASFAATHSQSAASEAEELSARAERMMQRGLHCSARAELLKSLRLLAESLDADQGSGVHAAALAAAQVALQNSQDAATPAARQQPLAVAQTQLTIAAGNSPAAALALYRLGRVHAALAGGDAAGESPYLSQAIVCHQAALAADSANHLAANELGVLLANSGQLPAAKQILLHSVSLQPQSENWHNLAVVHRRLGESDLARRAEHERDLALDKGVPRARQKSPDSLRWVDAPLLASTSGRKRGAADSSVATASDIPWRENAQSELAASPAGQRR